MTNPKPGDRIRGTVEGVVSIHHTVLIEGEWTNLNISDLKNVEVIPEPIVWPTKPGTMVITDPEDVLGQLMVFLFAPRSDDDPTPWTSLGCRSSNDDVEFDMEQYGYRIIEAVEA